jgi:mRNA-degrading endonuclease RelE of RelBE toxin-antitoxin system
MTYKVIRDPVADAEIDDFGRYAADYSESFARKQFARLNRFFTVEIAESPKTWSYFYITGAPYRAYLFRAGRRTNYWIVYTVDDVTKTVNVLRFWNARKEPAAFES